MAGAIASGRPLPKAAQSPAVAKDTESPDRTTVKSLAARLSQVERLNRAQAAKLARQAREVDRLQAELRILREQASPTASDTASEDRCVGEADTGGAGGDSSGTSATQMRRLCAERDHFKRQVEEMSKFLEDYGLTWVGDDGAENGGHGEEGAEDGSAVSSADGARPGSGGGTGGSRGEGGSPCGSPVAKSSRQQTPLTLNVDIAAMKACIEGLNSTVEKTGARVVSDRVGGAVHARLVADDTLPLPLTFFRDGVKLGEAAFQDFRQPAAQQLLRDILDGYFPYVLKDRYPDGVLLRVVDRTAHAFEDWLRERAASDAELADGGDRVLPSLGRAVRAPCSGPGVRLGGQGAEPVGRTPEKVVRGGEICEGPGAAAGKGPGAGNAGQRGNSAPVGERGVQGEVSMLDPGREPTAPVVRLQVKFESGQRVLLCMEPTHTIGALEDALNQWPAGAAGAAEATAAAGQRLLLQSAFPRRSYTDRAQTLADAGLVPSATLFATSAASDG